MPSRKECKIISAANPNVAAARMAEDRANQLRDPDVDDEIQRRLRKHANARADFAKVHACVPAADVPDEREARLVILGPDHPDERRTTRSVRLR